MLPDGAAAPPCSSCTSRNGFVSPQVSLIVHLCSCTTASTCLWHSRNLEH